MKYLVITARHAYQLTVLPSTGGVVVQGGHLGIRMTRFDEADIHHSPSRRFRVLELDWNAYGPVTAVLQHIDGCWTPIPEEEWDTLLLAAPIPARQARRPHAAGISFAGTAH